MAPPDFIETERLLLRRWTEADRLPFADLNADPVVMAHFASPLSHSQSNAVAARLERHFDTHGFGLWAVEIKHVASFAGFIGLSVPAFDAPFTPCIEVGWRLAAADRGRGYAREGATAAMGYGFDTLGIAEIVAFTVPANTRSRRLMERLGMARSASDDFDHPRIPEGHPLRRHVLYRRSASTASSAA